ncbi:MAG: leucine-rich repeat domain-containing protein [Tannerella sp.]
MIKSITTVWLIALFTIMMGAATVQAQNPTSGTAGPLTWKYDTDMRILTISGKGEMPDYVDYMVNTTNSMQLSPWLFFRERISKVVIEDGVKYIGTNAFLGFKMDSVVISESVTRIGKAAFSSCTNLSVINIPTGVTRIEDNTFTFCKKLNSIILHTGITEIGSGAFAFSTLTQLTIPAGVKKIGARAFSGCKNLSAIAVDPGNMNFTSVDGVLFDKAKATLVQYPAGRKETTYTVPVGVKKIAEGAADNSPLLTSIMIPTGVDTIAARAFMYCEALASVALPASVKTFRYGVFWGCKSLKSLTVGMKTPPAINKNEDVFEEVPVANVTLTVPKGSKAAYAAAPVWKEFKQIGESTVGNVTLPEARIYAAGGRLYLTLQTAAPVGVYTLNGVLVRTFSAPAGETTVALPQGVYIVRVGDTAEKVYVN